MCLTSSLNGVEHWLFALEYYNSSIDIANKLSLKRPVDRPPTYFSSQFISVSIIYSLLQAGCCVGQRFLNQKLNGDSQYSLENTVPNTLLLFFNVLTTVLLILAI